MAWLEGAVWRRRSGRLVKEGVELVSVMTWGAYNGYILPLRQGEVRNVEGGDGAKSVIGVAEFPSFLSHLVNSF